MAMKYFLIIGISQGIFLSIILTYKSRLKGNNAWLIALFVLLIGIVISAPLLNDWLGEPIGSFMVDPLIWLIGPSFYLYILSFSKKQRPIDYLLHSLAFLVYIPVLYFFFVQNVTAGLKRPELQKVYSSTFLVTIGLLKFFHLFVYVFLSFKALTKHKKKVKQVFADLAGKDLAWLRYMLAAFVFLSVVSLLLYILALQYPQYQDQLSLLNLALLSVFILTISFYAFHQNTLFDYDMYADKPQQLEDLIIKDEGPKYEKSGLKEEEVQEIKQKIQAFIQEKRYLNPNVTLGSMSENIGVYPHKVSEVLGKHMQTSFYDLINSHRVDDIKNAIHDPAFSHLTILSIAYDFGYNSKSTFNTAFKKFTGTTPSAYKNVSA